MDEVDVFNRLEFELFAFGILPSSSCLPLLKDREVVYVNLLPPRPPTPFSLSLAPPRDENSLVAEVRRPGTGQPLQVVYTHQTSPNAGNDESRNSPMKRGRFKEHLSDAGSRPQSPSMNLEPGLAISGGSSRPKSATRAWYKETESPASGSGRGREDPFEGTDREISSSSTLTLEV